MNKFLSTVGLLCLCALTAFGANPSYTDFIGVGGITVTSNPPPSGNGKITIDGSGISAGALPTYALTNNQTTPVNLASHLRVGGVLSNVTSAIFLGTGVTNNGSLAQNGLSFFSSDITVAGGGPGQSVSISRHLFASFITSTNTITLLGLTTSRVLMINSLGQVTNVTTANPTTDLVFGDGSTGTAGSNSITANAINDSKILDGTIGTNKIRQALNSSLILDATIVTADLADASVSSNKLVASSVNSSKILDATVVLADIQNAAANSKVLGSGDAGAGASYVELTVGSGLQIVGTTLSATGGAGGGGTNYPPIIPLGGPAGPGTNVVVGVGVRQHVTITTNASFNFNSSGVWRNGETVTITVSNSSASQIFFTNLQNNTVNGVFYHPFGSNVTTFGVPPLSLYTITLVQPTNAFGGTTNLIAMNENSMEKVLAVGYKTELVTNGNLVTMQSTERQTNYATGTLTINCATDVQADITNTVASAYTITLASPVIGTSGTLSFTSDNTARQITLSCPALAALANGGMSWLSTNGTTLLTNVLTGAGGSTNSVLAWSVRARHMAGQAPTTNILVWHKHQTP